jgi:hypothetical protein
MAYRPRVVDAELHDLLARAGAIVVEGPKACGKTATARQFAASEVLLDVDASMRTAAQIAPSLVLEGPAPRLIDAWQSAPELWNHVRRAVDDRRSRGQFLLTGSAAPADDLVRHTGAGRISRLRMRPMTLFEQGTTDPRVSLRALVDGEPVSPCPDPGLTIHDLCHLIASGGWPGTLGDPDAHRAAAVADYLEEIARADISRVDGISRDPIRVRRLLRSLARNVATEVATTTLAADAAGPDAGLTAETVRSYLAALERLMVIEDQPSWAPHLRSRSILRSAPKRHFVDPSLAVAALGATPQRLLTDLGLLGSLFESLVIRELRVFAQSFGGRVLHYRDNTGLEVDAVVERADGGWAAFEAKLGPAMVDQGADTLTRFADRVDQARMGPPAALVVLVGWGLGYRRADGVDVVPIGALGPGSPG